MVRRYPPSGVYRRPPTSVRSRDPPVVFGGVTGMSETTSNDSLVKRTDGRTTPSLPVKVDYPLISEV